DTSTSRTLAEASTSSPNMTVESCFAFCTAGGFSFAGVEFGSECYCDYTIQFTGILSSEEDCQEACSGNSTETCGAGNFIDIYWNGTPLPITPIELGPWSYGGCFPDSASARQLPNQIMIPEGVTVESCTSACEANGFDLAGLEFGQECWCGDTLLSSSVVRDACATACVANTSEFCGGSNLMTIYENPFAQDCYLNTLFFAFNLSAVSPTDGTITPLHVAIIETVPLISWSILTVRFVQP
ncbi:WSC domain-containing protein, partial [Mycena sanguinolenta]